MSRPRVIVWITVHAAAFFAGLWAMQFEGGWRGIGISMVGSSVVGFFLVAYVYLTHRTQERIESLAAAGIVKIFPYRSATIRSEYESRLQSAKNQIDILGFGLATLLGDFREEFRVWETKARVRILLIDPEFPDSEHSFAAQRDVEEGDQCGTIRDQVKAFVRDVAPLVRARNRFSVRLYRAGPSVNYFRIDNVAFWGPYFVRERSRNMPTILISRSGALFDPLAKHFDELWSSFSREVPDEWLRGEP